MPEMRFVIAWPDGRQETCYSPSLVIKDFFEEGETYPIRDFLDRSRKALTIASDRVEAKYGYPCSLARGQLARIENASVHFLGDADARVRCETFIF
jgi:uncharacterized repeat protein (TIGR04042 family)